MCNFLFCRRIIWITASCVVLLRQDITHYPFRVASTNALGLAEVLYNKENRVIKRLESATPLETLMQSTRMRADVIFVQELIAMEKYMHKTAFDAITYLRRQWGVLDAEKKREYEEAAIWVRNFRKEMIRSLSHVLKMTVISSSFCYFLMEHGIGPFYVGPNDVKKLYAEKILKDWRTTMKTEDKEPYFRQSEESIQDYIEAVSNLSTRQQGCLKILLREQISKRVLKSAIDQLPSRQRLRELIEIAHDAPKFPVIDVLFNFKKSGEDPSCSKEEIESQIRQYHTDFDAWKAKMIKSGRQAELQMYRLTRKSVWQKMQRRWARLILRQCRIAVLSKIALENGRPFHNESTAPCVPKFIDTCPGKQSEFLKSQLFLTKLQPQLEKWEKHMRREGRQHIVALFKAEEYGRDWVKMAKALNVYRPFNVHRTQGDKALGLSSIWKLMSEGIYFATLREAAAQQTSKVREKFSYNKQPLSPFCRLVKDELRNKTRRIERYMAIKRAMNMWRRIPLAEKQRLMAEHQSKLQRWEAWKAKQDEIGSLQQKLLTTSSTEESPEATAQRRREVTEEYCSEKLRADRDVVVDYGVRNAVPQEEEKEHLNLKHNADLEAWKTSQSNFSETEMNL